MKKTKEEHSIQDSFNEAIKKKLKNYSVPVNENIWENINIQINKKPKKKIIYGPWIAGLATAACIILIWLIFPFNREISPYFKPIASLSTDEKTHREDIIKEKIPLIIYDSFLPDKSLRGENELYQKENRTSFVNNAIKKKEEEDSIIISEPNFIEKNRKDTNPENEKKTDQIKRSYPSYEKRYPTLIAKNEKKKTSLGIHIGSSSGSFTASNNNPKYLAYETHPLKGNYLASNSAEVQKENKLMAKDFSDVSHHIPLSFGINMRKELNDILSIETGLVYSYLYSKFKNNLPNQELKQELHYLGIPIKVIANIYSGKSSWNIYASAGTTVEKGLSAKYTQTLYHDELSPSTSSHQSISGLQWSLNAAIGFDYKIVKNYSIYIEPSLNYYLNNNQPLNSRTENPFTIGIAAGIRYFW